jgi:hypothetical protein
MDDNTAFPGMIVSYILLRNQRDGSGQCYAGMFDNQSPDFARLLAEARVDTGLVVVRTVTAVSLPSVYWSDVSSQS